MINRLTSVHGRGYETVRADISFMYVTVASIAHECHRFTDFHNAQLYSLVRIHDDSNNNYVLRLIRNVCASVYVMLY